MKTHLIVLIGITCGMLLLPACGKKGPLEAPAGATEAPKSDQTVQPMDNPTVTPKWPGTAAPSTGSSY